MVLETPDKNSTFGTPKTIVFSTKLAQKMSPEAGGLTQPIRSGDSGHMIKNDQW